MFPALTRRQHGRQAPAWVVTFADLMALLTTFFILLLSFSQIDVQKYRQIVESMGQAFTTVQMPLAARPAPAPVTPRAVEAEPPAPAEPPTPARPEPVHGDPLFERFRSQLQAEIADRQLKLRRNPDGELVISFQHEAAFESGSAVLIEHFRPVIDRIAVLISLIDGQVVVAGHSDNLPIQTERFRSNWELSSARAVSVLHQLMQEAAIDPKRLVVEGHADTQPLVPNDTPQHRALNRRVEIRIQDNEAPPAAAENHG